MSGPPKDPSPIHRRNWASISTLKLSSVVRPTYPSLWGSILLSVGVIFVLKIDGSPSSLTFSFLLGSSIIFLLIATARALWALFIYPQYRSPLRHLPQPPDKPSLLMGHFWQMMEIGPGDLLRSWSNTVPNNGLIRYLDFFNLERVAIVSPAALADLLVHKCYDFEKPPQLRHGVSRILGLGLFLSEGDVHKVSKRAYCYLPSRVLRVRSEAEKGSHAGLRLQAYQEPVSHVLEQIGRISGRNPPQFGRVGSGQQCEC